MDRAVQVLPPDQVQLVSAPAQRDLGLGVLPLTDEMVAAAEATAADRCGDGGGAAAGRQPDPVHGADRQQGSRGTCVSFTLTALNEYILHAARLPERPVRAAPVLRDQADRRGVQPLRDLAGPGGERAAERGGCREVIWPYNPSSACNSHGTLQPRPGRTGSTTAEHDPGVAEERCHVQEPHVATTAVTLSIPVYDSWYLSAETRRSGRITMRVGNEVSEGGHAVLLVGYQDSREQPGRRLLHRPEQLGTGWAYASPYGPGYGTIPYQYIANEASEAFTAAVRGSPRMRTCPRTRRPATRTSRRRTGSRR